MTSAEENSTLLAFPLKLRTDALDAGSIVIEADFAEGTLAMLAGISTVKVSITDADSYAYAAGELAKIKAVAKKIDADRKELTKPLDDEKSKVMDYVRPYTSALERAEAEFKRALLAYEQEQTRKRELAEAEEAERLRKKQETLVKRAENAEAGGHEEKAETLREQAATAVYVAPPPVAAPPKVSGLSSRKTYGVEVIDLSALAKACVAQSLLNEAAGDPAKLMQIITALAAKPAPMKYLAADTKVLNTIASAMKEDYDVPGTKLVIGASMSSRAAK